MPENPWLGVPPEDRKGVEEPPGANPELGRKPPPGLLEPPGLPPRPPLPPPPPPPPGPRPSAAWTKKTKPAVAIAKTVVRIMERPFFNFLVAASFTLSVEGAACNKNLGRSALPLRPGRACRQGRPPVYHFLNNSW